MSNGGIGSPFNLRTSLLIIFAILLLLLLLATFSFWLNLDNVGFISIVTAALILILCSLRALTAVARKCFRYPGPHRTLDG